MMSLLFCALCFHRWQALKEWEGHPWGQPGIRMESQIILATLSTIVDNKSSYHLASISSFGRGPWDGYKWSRVSTWHSATAVFVSRSDKITFKIDMIPNPFLKSLLSLFCHSLVLFFLHFFSFLLSFSNVIQRAAGKWLAWIPWKLVIPSRFVSWKN